MVLVDLSLLRLNTLDDNNHLIMEENHIFQDHNDYFANHHPPKAISFFKKRIFILEHHTFHLF